MHDGSDKVHDSAESSACGSRGLRSLDELNEWLLRYVEEQITRIEGEEAQQRVLDAVTAKLPRVFDGAAEEIVKALFESAPVMLAEYNALDASHAAEVEEQWAQALGVYRMLWVSCHETGEMISTRHFNLDGYEPSAMVYAQVGLQARACRVALEVLALLRAGLGAGALGRARTLYEIATISTVLAEYGAADAGQPDLADRYLLHANVVNWLDAVEYQEVAPKLGYELLTDAEVAHLRAARDSAVAVYGEAFGKPNGWAAGLMSNQKAPRFKDLEVLASADHMRAHYSWASHEVHADSKSLVMNHETDGYMTFRNTGPSPRGMADAAQLALMALVQVTENTLYSASDVDKRPADPIVAGVLHKLLDRAWIAFSSADTANGRKTSAGHTDSPSADTAVPSSEFKTGDRR